MVNIIRRTVKDTVTATLERDIQFFEQFDLANQLATERAVEEARGAFMADLRHYPRKRNASDYPLPWKHERQRRAAMANIRKLQGGLPYKRTGRIRDGWRIETDRNGHATNIVVENTTPHARFVIGSLAQRSADALKFQQAFHQSLWQPPATQTVDFYLAAIEERRAEIIDEELRDLVTTSSSQRAYTSRRRRR